jgi:hypothetical protein
VGWFADAEPREIVDGCGTLMMATSGAVAAAL